MLEYNYSFGISTSVLRSVIYTKKVFQVPLIQTDRHIVKIQCNLFVGRGYLYLAWPAKEFPARDSNNGHVFSSLFL